MTENEHEVPGGEEEEQAALFGAGESVLIDTPPDPNALLEETLLPVQGMVRLSEREMELIDHPAFQRLFEIFQLGQTHLVYRGATHMRGQHAVGSVQAVTAMAEAITRNHERQDKRARRWTLSDRLSPVELAFVRLGALLHDIGHLPAGHTLEDELGLLPQHDTDQRMDFIFDRAEWHGRTFEPLRTRIDRLYEADAAEAGQTKEDGRELTASEIVVRLVSRDHKDAPESGRNEFRLSVCRDLIGNTICADLLDYLHRDWMHLGKQRHFDPRLLDYLEIRERPDDATGEPIHRVVINLRGGTRPRPDAVTAILDLLESRYQLSEIALFHRVKLSAAGMLERVIAEYRDTFADEREQADALEEFLPKLLEASDFEMLKLFEAALRERRTARGRSTRMRTRIDGAIELAQRLRVRELHRDLHVFYENDVGGDVRAQVIAQDFAGMDGTDEKADQLASLARAAANRLNALRLLEEDFGLNPGELVMYCPTRRMNMKIARVGVLLDDHVDTLADLDEYGGRVTGGHLAAQLARFRRLWRIAFAIDRSAYAKLADQELVGSLIETIRIGLLGIPPAHGTLEDAIRRVAQDMARNERSPWAGRKLVDAPALGRAAEGSQYLTGVWSITAHMAEPST
jgi:HD superfamily phosphohydrolase